jgi:V/A-type H+-transporting ATPase subunit E
MKKNDLRFKDNIISILGRGVTFKESDDIEIGGIRALDPDKGILIDETLDTKLEDQRKWFIENCRMQI